MSKYANALDGRGSVTVPSCTQCGSHVSVQYHRVFAADGRLEGCPACSSPVAR